MRNAGVPAIVLSGGDADDLVLASARAGCVGYPAEQDLSPEGWRPRSAPRWDRRPSAPESPGEELRMLLAALSDLSRASRMRPLASRLMSVTSELRRSLPGAEDAVEAALEELSELTLMLWLELDGGKREALPARTA